ncbi:unnamed protein product [Arabidopsis lyrata]|uniref:Predicted protein n=1 Tax=Arabidopsis lyrata subsp. lyrata TaxID=81972 RepID=D7LTE8_ARALL|nr:predicted protein [Arabidopsis lyrata subsp. lyrata]CAH8268135.1 unnamed protein product [Arabidopsis lyrata]
MFRELRILSLFTNETKWKLELLKTAGKEPLFMQTLLEGIDSNSREAELNQQVCRAHANLHNFVTDSANKVAELALPNPPKLCSLLFPLLQSLLLFSQILKLNYLLKLTYLLKLCSLLFPLLQFLLLLSQILNKLSNSMIPLLSNILLSSQILNKLSNSMIPLLSNIQQTLLLTLLYKLSNSMIPLLSNIQQTLCLP